VNSQFRHSECSNHQPVVELFVELNADLPHSPLLTLLNFRNALIFYIVDVTQFIPFFVAVMGSGQVAQSATGSTGA